MTLYSFRFAVVTLVFAGVLCADPVVPGNLLEPRNAKEAWNAIRLATNNVDRLIKEKRPAEVPVQISFCSPSLRALVQFCESADALPKVQELAKKGQAWVNMIAQAGSTNQLASVSDAFKAWREVLGQLGKYFDVKTVSADIYFCPMHPTFASPKREEPCGMCGMSLLKRRIPYSFIYMQPGEASVRMSAVASGPVEAGKKLEVKVRLQFGDRTPVAHDDLIVMHTQPIHLLIEEPGLGDYHHEHPVPTEVAGEYAFSFTPTKTTPYRIWADIVPAATGMQEMPFVDLASAGRAGEIEDKVSTYASKVRGHTFALSFGRGSIEPPSAGRVCTMNVMISDTDGKPTANLEPVMNAFAHLVGFYDDFKTVVHVHPNGGDILNQESRGGPGLAFQFFPPRAGFIRFYCQVMIDGEMIFAPFNVNVVAQESAK